MSQALRATPFHARAVAANRWNAWENRGGFTLAKSYETADEEIAAARFGAVAADLSWYGRISLRGEHAPALVARLFSRDASALGLGAGLDVLWLNDAGAVRGAGTVLRLAADHFVLMAADVDRAWMAAAAKLFAVTVEEVFAGQLALIGPAAEKILAAAGLEVPLPRWSLRRLSWRGLDICLTRLGLGYEIWCDGDCGDIVWDRLFKAGASFALVPAGQAALDALDGDAGLLKPGRDFAPARDGFSVSPTPQALGLCALADRSHLFNGRSAFLAAGPDTVLAGFLSDDEVPAAGSAVSVEGREAGRVVTARYSPLLRQVTILAAMTGPLTKGAVKIGHSVCRPAGLPFLPLPAAPELNGSSV